MTIQDAYLQFLTKVNRNLNSNNVTADKQRFVLLYNESQIDEIVHAIREGNDERLREIQLFLKPDTQLSFDSNVTDRVLYLLPIDYLDLSSAYALADKDKCVAQKINLLEIKDKNYTQVLSDNYNKPTFEFREAPFIIADNKLNIFTAEDFTFKKAVLTYYRFPTKVDIEGYININNVSSTNIDPEGSDKFVNRVVNRAALNYSQNYQDVQGININKDRVQTNR